VTGKDSTRNANNSSKLTIDDVARTAGVSVSTVSRILNDRPDVAEATREHVKQVIEELGYSPHFQARRLAAGRTRTIALLYPFEEPSSHVELGFITGAAAAAGQEGYFFNLMTHTLSENELLNLYRGAQVDGVVLGQVHMNDRRVNLLRDEGLPFSMIGQCSDNTGVDFIDLDFYDFVEKAFDYLVGLGHRRIGFLNYPRTAGYDSSAADYGPMVRCRTAFERACEKHSLAPLYKEVEYNVHAVSQATLELLDEQPDLTAIFAADGARAVGIIRALRQCGRHVPDDFSVLGIAPDTVAELVNPPLSTIDFPIYDMSYRAAKMLIRRLEHDPADIEQILIKAKIEARQTTSPPRE
jgi:DNA-binding LacI/PurR family transcriptional regulator